MTRYGNAQGAGMTASHLITELPGLSDGLLEVRS